MEELKKAPVTVFLILANILVFTAVEFTGGSEDTMHMLQCGAAYTPAIMQGEYYRIFTSMFLHFGPQHLGNNMLVLFVLGGRLERTVGKLKYLLIYLLGGMGGNLLCIFPLDTGLPTSWSPLPPSSCVCSWNWTVRILQFRQVHPVQCLL